MARAVTCSYTTTPRSFLTHEELEARHQGLRREEAVRVFTFSVETTCGMGGLRLRCLPPPQEQVRVNPLLAKAADEAPELTGDQDDAGFPPEDEKEA
eukprot:4672052-Pyramimonas_sp.AAC.1